MDPTLVVIIIGSLAGAACGLLFGRARRAVVLDVVCALGLLYLISLAAGNEATYVITGEYSSQHIESAIDFYFTLTRLEAFLQGKLFFIAAASMFAAIVPAQLLGLWLFPAARPPFNPRTLRGIYHIIIRIGLVLTLGLLCAVFAQNFMAEFSRIEPGLSALAGKTVAEKDDILLKLLSTVSMTRYDLDGIWRGMIIAPPVLYWLGVGCLWVIARVGGLFWKNRAEIEQAANQGVEAGLRGALTGSSKLRSWGSERLTNARKNLDSAQQP